MPWLLALRLYLDLFDSKLTNVDFSQAVFVSLAHH
jgi:hypothetical protein